MAQARRKSAGRRKKLDRNWLLLALGLGIGVAAAVLGQMLIERNVHGTVGGWFKPKPAAANKADTREADKPKSKFDFYTILPETETVLPERSRRDARPVARPETREEDVSYVLQAASFNNFDDADQLKARLALQGLSAQIQKVVIEGRGEYHRVRLGPYQKLDELDAANQQLLKMGIKAMRLKVVRKSAS